MCICMKQHFNQWALELDRVTLVVYLFPVFMLSYGNHILTAALHTDSQCDCYYAIQWPVISHYHAYSYGLVGHLLPTSRLVGLLSWMATCSDHSSWDWSKGGSWWHNLKVPKTVYGEVGRQNILLYERLFQIVDQCYSNPKHSFLCLTLTL